MKLCKDCKWCHPSKTWSIFPRKDYVLALCMLQKSPVSGETDPTGYCVNERYCGANCGPDAKLFEPKT